MCLRQTSKRRVISVLAITSLLVAVYLYISYSSLTTNVNSTSIWRGGNADNSNTDMLAYSKRQHTIVVFNPAHWMPLHLYNAVLSGQCAYRNCQLSTDRSNLKDRSAILYVLTEAPRLPPTPPLLPSQRPPDQVWIFYWLEPPVHHASSGEVYKNKHWRDTVNWTMTYTRDADISTPYGRIIERTPPIKNYSAIFHRKTKMAAWAVGHCDTSGKREIFVSGLQRHGVSVDIYGRCVGKRVSQSELLTNIDQNYKFYLAFENSFCNDYVTEKFFTYLQLDVVLVVRGAANYSSLLPSNSFINSADFRSAKDLAEYLLYVSSNEERYTSFLRNKNHFDSVLDRNERFCELCRKLNNLDSNRRTYTDFVETVHRETCFVPKVI